MQFTGNYAETVPFRKISIPRKLGEMTVFYAVSDVNDTAKNKENDPYYI